jgi:hypothetical protein
MIFKTLTLGSLPNEGPHLLASVSSFVRGLLTGVSMKFSSRVFNIKALQNHLALTRAQAQLVDSVAETLDLKQVNITLHVRSEKDMRILSQPKTGDAADNCILAIHCEDMKSAGYDDVKIQILAPLSILKKGCSDTSHLVYRIDTFSAERFDLYAKTGELPMPKTENLPVVDGFQMPFDVATRGKVPVYVGKTSVGFANRLKQHFASAFGGSNTRFHKILRGSDKYYGQWPICQILGSFDSESKAYDFEEEQIKKLALEEGAYCCNTIGSRQAFENLITLEPRLRSTVSAEDAEELLMLRSKLATAQWDDPEYAESVICNNERNFDADEVRLIRSLFAMKMPTPVIAKRFTVPEKRVKLVVEGRTYSRIL